MGIQRNTLIILAVFLVVLLVALALPRIVPQDDPLADLAVASQPVLIEEPFTEFTALRITDATGKTLQVERVDDFSWRMLEPQEAGPDEIDSFALQGALVQLMNLQYTPLAESMVELAAVGLDTPAYILQVTLSDERIYTLEVGNANSLGNGYFARLNDGAVVMLNAQSAGGVLALLDTPLLLPTSVPEGVETPSPAP